MTNSEIIITYISKITGKKVHYELYDLYLTEGELRQIATGTASVDHFIDNNVLRVIVVEDHSTHKKVFLGVPVQPDTDNCMGAIAWTFTMSKEDYKPILES